MWLFLLGFLAGVATTLFWGFLVTARGPGGMRLPWW